MSRVKNKEKHESFIQILLEDTDGVEKLPVTLRIEHTLMCIWMNMNLRSEGVGSNVNDEMGC